MCCDANTAYMHQFDVYLDQQQQLFSLAFDIM